MKAGGSGYNELRFPKAAGGRSGENLFPPVFAFGQRQAADGRDILGPGITHLMFRLR
jgi:hypothetical protein